MLLKNQRRAFQQCMPEDGHLEHVLVGLLVHSWIEASTRHLDHGVVSLSHSIFPEPLSRDIEVVTVIAQLAPFP
jgi:hypothetical protein